MGLDTYVGARPPTQEDWNDPEGRFGLTDEDEAAFVEVEGSYFRGKIFDDLVREITGIGLYREWIPPETVAFMADAFEDCDPEATLRELDSHREHSPDTIETFARFFRICADRHLGLVGSW